jgi:hypothetical protein
MTPAQFKQVVAFVADVRPADLDPLLWQALHAAVAMLQRLPRTEDGVPMVPGDRVVVDTPRGRRIRTLLSVSKDSVQTHPEEFSARTVYDPIQCTSAPPYNE